MNPEQNLDEILDRYITSAKQEEVESHCEEVFQRLQTRANRPVAHSTPNRSIRRSFWPVAAAVAATIAIAILLPTRIVQSAPATLEDANGKRKIQFGEIVRPIGDMSAMLSMADGPRVETRSMSEFSLERADDGGTRIRLNMGGLIVDAASAHGGNLYVQTKDINALVSGAVSLVKAEAEGSSVVALGGEVRVQQGAETRNLRPGEQIRTNPRMQVLPVPEEIAWSQNADAHMALLQQQPATTATGEQNKFEVLVVRPESGNAGLRGAPVRCNGSDGVFPLPPSRVAAGVIGAASAVPRGRCVGRYVTLITLITTAYGVPEANVSGGPDWMRSSLETFQIEAKAEAYSTVTKDQLREMLQTLLMDRFKLRIRRDTKQGRGYVLGVSQNGSQLRPASGDEDLYLEQNGRRNQFNLLLGGQLSIKGQATLRTFADYLSVAPILGLNHVEDRTALSGMYEFSLTLNMIPPELPGRGGVRGADSTGQSSPRVEWDPSIAKAIESQLGLSLVSQTVQEPVLIVEHAEKPSEN